MTPFLRIVRSQLRDVARSKWVVGSGLFFLLVTEALLVTGGTSTKALLSLINVVLLLVPLVAVVFGTMYLYHARDFVLLLLAQPVRRRDLFFGLYSGLAIPLALSFAVGVSLPFLWHGAIESGSLAGLLTLIGGGTFLTLIFLAIAFLVAIRHIDRVKGIGVALLAWLVMAVVYDGIVLLIVAAFSNFPLERPLIAVMMANPVDLARVLLLMVFDAGAMMGYTGAVFGRFFGSTLGVVISSVALMLWTAAPLWLAWRAFRVRDF